jgi:hypothetical protein
LAAFRIVLSPAGIIFGLEGFFAGGTSANFMASFNFWVGPKKGGAKPAFLLFHPGAPK